MPSAKQPSMASTVTPETLRAEVATVHGAINSLRADIYRAMLLQAGAIVGAVVAILRLLG